MSDGPLIKICGLQRREDVLLADVLGADFVGVVLSTGFGRSVDQSVAAALLEGVAARKVAVVVDESVESMVDLASSIDADVIQLHGDESPDDVAELRTRGPWRVWKGLRCATLGEIEQAVTVYQGSVDGFLVEGRRDGVIGGGGAVLGIEPEGVRGALPSSRVFVLAGGLTADIVGGMVTQFCPDVVDVSSGVESHPGGKDPDLLRSFFAAVGRAPLSPRGH